jgi:hypothetical protein
MPKNPEFCERSEPRAPDIRTAWGNWTEVGDVQGVHPAEDQESRTRTDIQDGYRANDDLAAKRQQVAGHVGETAVGATLAETSEADRAAQQPDDRSADHRHVADIGDYAIRSTQLDQARTEANVAARTTDNRVNLADDVTNTENTRTFDGYLDVVMHGGPNGTEAHINGDVRPYTLEETAQLVEQTAGWDHRPVRLMSCSTGQETYAQDLANRLGVPVYAPSGDLLVFPDGSTAIDNGGQWRRFEPDPR